MDENKESHKPNQQQQQETPTEQAELRSKNKITEADSLHEFVVKGAENKYLWGKSLRKEAFLFKIGDIKSPIDMLHLCIIVEGRN